MELDEHGEEKDEKTKRNLEILKNYKKKEIKNVKYIFLTILLLVEIFVGMYVPIPIGMSVSDSDFKLRDFMDSIAADASLKIFIKVPSL